MNRILTTHLESEFYFPLYKAAYKVLQLKLAEAGESEDTYAVLAPDCKPSYNKVVEERKSKLVKFYVMLFSAGVAFASFPDINSCETLNVSDIELT
jgi:hypothetical protein